MITPQSRFEIQFETSKVATCNYDLYQELTNSVVTNGLIIGFFTGAFVTVLIVFILYTLTERSY